MRAVLGAVYFGLLALIAVFVVDILVSGAAIGPTGDQPAWLGLFRKILLYVGLAAGIAIGTWRGYQKGKGSTERRQQDQP